MKKKDKILVFAVLISFVVFLCWFTYYTEQYTETTYSLSEIDDEVFAIYHTVSSNVPAKNYEVITICCDGNLYTFKGDVSITYSDNESYAIVRRYNIVNGDEVHVYIPKGTVEYQGNVGLK